MSLIVATRGVADKIDGAERLALSKVERVDDILGTTGERARLACWRWRPRYRELRSADS